MSHIRTHRQADKSSVERKGRYCWQSVRHRKAVFNTAASFSSPSLQLRVPEGLSRPDETSDTGRWIARKTFRKMSFQRLLQSAEQKEPRGGWKGGKKHFSLESNPQLKNRNATHSSGCKENESLDEFGGEMGLCESQGGESVVSLLLSLSLPRLVGAKNAGGKSLCARKTELLTATAPSSPLQTPRWLPDVWWIRASHSTTRVHGENVLI